MAESFNLLRFLSSLFDRYQAPVSPIGEDYLTPTPTPATYATEEGFKQGFENYGSDLATASGQFNQAAQQYPLPDPYAPATLSLMETSGGKKQRFAFNPFNWGMKNYPNLESSINDIYSGISGKYKSYLQSGDIGDLLRFFTPSTERRNPSQKVLRQRYENLRENFPKPLVTETKKEQSQINQDFNSLVAAFIGPNHKITQEYGARPWYYKLFGLTGHEGVDVSAKVGTPIYAPFDGTVEISATPKQTPNYRNYGNWIRVKNISSGDAFDLAHLSQLSLRPGETFRAGDIIGYTGNTGNTTGPHLHISVWRGGRRINPMTLQQTATITSQPTTPSIVGVNRPQARPGVVARQNIASQPVTNIINYLIKKGDTLSQIAKQNRTTVQAIMQTNPQIKNPNKIYAGNTLRIA